MSVNYSKGQYLIGLLLQNSFVIYDFIHFFVFHSFLYFVIFDLVFIIYVCILFRLSNLPFFIFFIQNYKPFCFLDNFLDNRPKFTIIRTKKINRGNAKKRTNLL